GILTALLVATADADRLVEALNCADSPAKLHLTDVPSIYYTFAGEVPWVSDPSCPTEERNSLQPYQDTVQVDGQAIQVEILARRYGWETHHSTLNQANGALVPSRPFSSTFDLRGIPQSFDQVLPNGARAALSLSASSGFTGYLLYLRADLVRQYAAGRQLIWVFWGERELHPYSYHEPRWLATARQDCKNVWRCVRKAEGLHRE
ncbi:MAG: hypothetical protein PHQ43_11365, partial [Dehalococcoidales bacterium]|nr:hypothetical protein [Dehalococcoidales bacterium]